METKRIVLRHIPALDGLRGIAIALVLLFHFGLGLNGASSGSAAPGQYYSRMVSIGWCGVDLFFVLSSFLITSILLDAKRAQHYFRNFYMRRVLRIFPLYYGFLVVMLLVAPWIASAESRQSLGGAAPWLLTYAQNFWIAGRDAWVPFHLNHLWSLAIEEQFYLVWPLLILVCSGRTITRVCLGIVIGALVLRCGLTLGGVSEKAIYVLPFARADAFAIGALVAIALRSESAFQRLASGAGPVAVVCVLVLEGLIAAQGGFFNWSDPWMQTIGFTTIALLFGALLIGAITSPAGAVLRRVCETRSLRFLGKYSYGVYIFHFPVLALMNHSVPRWYLVSRFGTGLGGQIAFLLAASAVSLLAAIISWHMFETRFLNLKRHFDTRHERPAARPGAEPRYPAPVTLDVAEART